MWLSEAVKQAFLDRGHIADPDFAAQDVNRWLSPLRLRAKARCIDGGRALDWPQPFRAGDTVFFAATDDDGRGVSVLQSLYYDWGSGVVAGDTGVLWQNRGAAALLRPRPESPNVPSAGQAAVLHARTPASRCATAVRACFTARRAPMGSRRRCRCC